MAAKLHIRETTFALTDSNQEQWVINKTAFSFQVSRKMMACTLHKFGTFERREINNYAAPDSGLKRVFRKVRTYIPSYPRYSRRGDVV